MDEFQRALRCGGEVILVGTGWDAQLAEARKRPIRHNQQEAYTPLGIVLEVISKVTAT